MGLITLFSIFVIAYVFLVAGQLISALKEKDSKKSKRKLLVFLVLAFPVWQFVVGKFAMETYFKGNAGYNISEKPKFREYLIEDSDPHTGPYFRIFHDIKLGNIDSLEISENTPIISALKRQNSLEMVNSKYYKVTNKVNGNCVWDTDNFGYARNVKNCFNIEPINTPKSTIAFKGTHNASVFLLPIHRDRTKLYNRNSGKELARFDSFEFYRFFGTIFKGYFRIC